MRVRAIVGLLGLAACDATFSLVPVKAPVPDAAPPVCPTTYTSLPGQTSSYRYVSNSKLWDQAADDCANDMDGATHLVVLADLAELEAVRTLVTDATTYNLHVGFARDTVAAGGDPNVFFAVTGERIESGLPGYELWEAGEPNNYMLMETIVFMENDARMRDGEPTRNERYVCECDGRAVTRTFVIR